VQVETYLQGIGTTEECSMILLGLAADLPTGRVQYCGIFLFDPTAPSKTSNVWNVSRMERATGLCDLILPSITPKAAMTLAEIDRDAPSNLLILR
jgi:hypothetical protein